jgi:hypothetical protein
METSGSAILMKVFTGTSVGRTPQTVLDATGCPVFMAVERNSGIFNLRVDLMRLKQDAAELESEVTLLLPSEVDLSKAAVIGRDNKLHVFSGDAWYVFSADSAV